MNKETRSVVEIVLGIGVGLVAHSFGWGFITLALSTVILESIATYWNQWE